MTDTTNTSPAPNTVDPGKKISHDNTWMSTVGDWIGTIVGGAFGGPAGSYVGGKAGADGGGTLGDLFGGNWDGVGSDIKAGPIGADPMFANTIGTNRANEGNQPMLGGNFANTNLFSQNDNPGTAPQGGGVVQFFGFGNNGKSNGFF